MALNAFTSLGDCHHHHLTLLIILISPVAQHHWHRNLSVLFGVFLPYSYTYIIILILVTISVVILWRFVGLSRRRSTLNAIAEIPVFVGFWVVTNNLRSLMERYGLLAYMSVFPKLSTVFYGDSRAFATSHISRRASCNIYMVGGSFSWLDMSLRNFYSRGWGLCVYPYMLAEGTGNTKAM